MADLTMCDNRHCPSHQQCYRYQAEPHPFWQYYMKFEPIEAEVAAPLEARIKGLIALYKERRCEICGYAEHHREHTGCLRVQLASANELIEQSREALAYYAKEDTRNARHYPPEFAGDVLAAIEQYQKGDSHD